MLVDIFNFLISLGLAAILLYFLYLVMIVIFIVIVAFIITSIF